VHRARIPADTDRAVQVTPQSPQARGHRAVAAVVRLEAHVEAQMWPRRGRRESGQRREPRMLVTIADARGLAGRCPGTPSGRDAPQAALIPEGELGPKSSGVFVWRATCRAAHGQGPARRAGGAAGLAPDHASRGDRGASRQGRDDRGRHTLPASRRPSASRSTARWDIHQRWRPAPTGRAAGHSAGRSTCTEGPAPAWGPRPRRRLAAMPCATGTPSSPTPALGAPPRARLTLAAGVPRRGAAAVLTSWVIQTVSCPIRYHRSLRRANLNSFTLIC
jgi:hypothetical protein